MYKHIYMRHTLFHKQNTWRKHHRLNNTNNNNNNNSIIKSMGNTVITPYYDKTAALAGS